MCGIRDQHSRCMSRNTHLAVSTNGRRPLLISTSLALIDRVVRLASTAALEVQVAPAAAALRKTHVAAVEARARAAGVRSVAPLALCFLPAYLLVGVVPVVAGFAGDLFQ